MAGDACVRLNTADTYSPDQADDLCRRAAKLLDDALASSAKYVPAEQAAEDGD